MDNNTFWAGFVSDLLDCLATYEVTKDTADLLPFWECVQSDFEPLAQCATMPQYPITDKEYSFLRVCEMVQKSIENGFLSLPTKHTILDHLDKLSTDITF